MVKTPAVVTGDPWFKSTRGYSFSLSPEAYHDSFFYYHIYVSKFSLYIYALAHTLDFFGPKAKSFFHSKNYLDSMYPGPMGDFFPVESKLPWASTSGHLFEVNQVKGILKISIPSRVFVTKTDKKTTRTVGLSHPLDVYCTHVGVAGSSLEIKYYSLFPY